LNIDATRIETTDSLGGGANKGMTAETRHEGFARPWMRDDAAREAAAVRSRDNTARAEALGRWPANVVLDEGQAAELDRQSGVTTSGGRSWADGDRDTSSWRAMEGRSDVGSRGDYARAGDSGGASRFFYVAKAGASERPKLDGTGHPTVKPLDLMRWLIRLVTPPGGTVLEPFLGSGTTAEACIVEGFRCIGIERDEQYMKLAKRRLAKSIAPVLDFGGAL
jgi:hypothetical protein